MASVRRTDGRTASIGRTGGTVGLSALSDCQIGKGDLLSKTHAISRTQISTFLQCATLLPLQSVQTASLTNAKKW